MKATIGDRLHVHSNSVGTHDRVGEIVEIRGDHGEPPYRVRFPDGRETLVYPGPDSIVESPGSAGRAAAKKSRTSTKAGASATTRSKTKI